MRDMQLKMLATGLAEKCEIQVAYAIGIAHPLSIHVDTFGTGNVSDAHVQEALAGNDLFDFRPAGLIEDLGLLTPRWSYRQTAAYGHFGRSQFPWEKTDKADALRALVS